MPEVKDGNNFVLQTVSLQRPDVENAKLGKPRQSAVILAAQLAAALSLAMAPMATTRAQVVEDIEDEFEFEEPEIEEPEIEEPEVAEPEIEEPEVAEPEVAEPEIEEAEVEAPESRVMRRTGRACGRSSSFQ